MHAVGVPYRVPSSQDQDSLRVLQYVEKQLAHFNPARSISHQCKLCNHTLWLWCFTKACWCCLQCLFILFSFSWHASVCSSFLPPEFPDIVAIVHAYWKYRVFFTNSNLQVLTFSVCSVLLWLAWIIYSQFSLINCAILICPACSLSELSSLHDGENSFRQTYRNVQKKALPAIPDQEAQPEPQQRRRENLSPESQSYRKNPPSPQRYCDDLDSEPRGSQDEPLPPRRYSDDPPSSFQSRRGGRNQRQQNQNDDNSHNRFKLFTFLNAQIPFAQRQPQTIIVLCFCRWNPRSEHLQRKTYRSAGRTGSLDELEEFASSYRQRGGRRTEQREEERGDYEMELLEFSRFPSYRDAPPQHYYSKENEHGDNSDHDDRPTKNKKNRHNISPLSSPKKRRGILDNECNVPPPPAVGPPSTSSREKDYDPTFLNSLLERKAKLRGVDQGKSGPRGEEDSDTPSKGSSKKSSGESSRHCSCSPNNRPEADSLSPYSDTERTRSDRPSPRTHPSHPPTHFLPGRREEPRDKSRKVVSHL